MSHRSGTWGIHYDDEEKCGSPSLSSAKMPFEPQTFAAELALGLIPTETFPLVAQDALADGFDGPWTRRMAVLEKPSGREVDQVIPKLLAELGVQLPSPEEAALLLAKLRVRRIRSTGEDPLRSIDYFHKLLWNGDYPTQLEELGWLEENYQFDDEAGVRAAAVEAMENLLDPELAVRRHAELAARIEERTRLARLDWPYVVNSPSGRKVFREQWKERLIELRSLCWFVLPAAALVGWSFSAWRFAFIYVVAMFPFCFTTAAVSVYRAMRRECQNFRWRNRIDL